MGPPRRRKQADGRRRMCSGVPVVSMGLMALLGGCRCASGFLARLPVTVAPLAPAQCRGEESSAMPLDLRLWSVSSTVESRPKVGGASSSPSHTVSPSEAPRSSPQPPKRQPPSSSLKPSELMMYLRTADHEESVVQLIEQIEASPEQLTLKDYTLMIGALKRVKGWKKAVDLLASMRLRGLQPNEITFNAVMGVCGVAGRFKEAVDLLRTMQNTGYEADAVTYGALMIAFVRGGQWEKALDVLQQMRQARLELTEGVYTAALLAYEKGHLWVNALEILREMHVKGIQPSVFGYNAAIFACQKDKQWVQAIALLGEMQQDGLKPDRVSFHGAMGACQEAGQSEGVMDLFEEMRALGIEPSRQSYEFVTKAVREYTAETAHKKDERMREYLKSNSISLNVLDEPVEAPSVTPPPATHAHTQHTPPPSRKQEQPRQEAKQKSKPQPSKVKQEVNMWANLMDDDDDE